MYYRTSGVIYGKISSQNLHFSNFIFASGKSDFLFSRYLHLEDPHWSKLNNNMNYNIYKTTFHESLHCSHIIFFSVWAQDRDRIISSISEMISLWILTDLKCLAEGHSHLTINRDSEARPWVSWLRIAPATQTPFNLIDEKSLPTRVRETVNTEQWHASKPAWLLGNSVGRRTAEEAKLLAKIKSLAWMNSFLSISHYRGKIRVGICSLQLFKSDLEDPIRASKTDVLLK